MTPAKTIKSRKDRLYALEASVMDAMSAVNDAERKLKWIIEEVRSLRHAQKP